MREPSLPDVIAVVEARRVVVRVDARDAVHVGHVGAVLVDEGLQQRGRLQQLPGPPDDDRHHHARAVPSSPTS